MVIKVGGGGYYTAFRGFQTFCLRLPDPASTTFKKEPASIGNVKQQPGPGKGLHFQKKM